MVFINNLPSILWELLFKSNQKGEARKWRVLGQEQDGSLLFTWVHICPEKPVPASRIGIYSHTNNTLRTLYIFDRIVNTIQASVNADQTLLAYVTKDQEDSNDDVTTTTANNGTDNQKYRVYLVEINTKEKGDIHYLHIQRSRQIMVQFLYRKQRKLPDRNSREKLVLFIHQEVILLYNLELTRKYEEEESEWVLYKDIISTECLARSFIWAQWDPIHQSLFYIHFRKPVKSLVEGEETDTNPEQTILSPTLSGLQFHDDLPHETVLNIPLNLPQLPHAGVKPCGIYADDVIPLRIHDCSLDLYIASDPRGIVCICHHYLYEPLGSKKDTSNKHNLSSFSGNSNKQVHLAYSITLLHHGRVLHCVVPAIKWTDAKAIRPTFVLYGEHHMIVFVPGLFTHLLDIGTSHEPMCHIVTSPNILISPDEDDECTQYHIVPLLNVGKNIAINLINLDLVTLNITTGQLIETFKNDQSTENKIAILHYLFVHQNEFDAVAELISISAERPMTLSMSKVLKEFLIAGAYTTSQRNLPTDALQLIHLLPITTMPTIKELEIKMNKLTIKLTEEVLWNTAMMLLSPQQRIVPYRCDMWTRLWEQLANISKGRVRFKTSQVTDKLMVSLVCYQPEALSRCSTPLSPSVGPSTSLSFNEISLSTAASRKSNTTTFTVDSLPFYEIETCTASKQEHVISVNLRELSMHLLKQTVGNSASGSTTKIAAKMWQSQQTPMHVHAVATRYVAAQLEISKLLCQLLCRSAGINSRNDSEKGFIFIDQLDQNSRYVLFTLLEKYYLCVESLAFPLPQGFNSFFAFLGYRVFSFNMFMQYVKRNVFQLQIDVMKIIMADINDSKEGVSRKLKLLSLLPRSRAKRLLSQWSHPISLMIRAREHALNILSGVEGQQPRLHSVQRTKVNQLGLAAFPSAGRLSPLDTFLDLLTAKASLTELDFGLLIEATIASTEEFL